MLVVRFALGLIPAMKAGRSTTWPVALRNARLGASRASKNALFPCVSAFPISMFVDRSHSRSLCIVTLLAIAVTGGGWNPLFHDAVIRVDNLIEAFPVRIADSAVNSSSDEPLAQNGV